MGGGACMHMHVCMHAHMYYVWLFDCLCVCLGKSKHPEK